MGLGDPAGAGSATDREPAIEVLSDAACGINSSPRMSGAGAILC